RIPLRIGELARLTFEASAFDRAQHFIVRLVEQFAFDLPERRFHLELTQDAKAPLALEQDVVAAILQCLDIADAPDATDVEQLRAVKRLLRLDHRDAPVAG